MASHLLFLIFPLGLIYGALSDVMTMTIPNRLILAMVAGFVLVLPFSGLSLPVLSMHVAAGALVLVIALGMFAMGWIGGGDAKFAAAIALWLGWDHLLAFALLSAMFGGVLTLKLLFFRRRMLPAFAVYPWVLRLHDSQSGVPYGIALALAALIIYPKTAWLALTL